MANREPGDAYFRLPENLNKKKYDGTWAAHGETETQKSLKGEEGIAKEIHFPWEILHRICHTHTLPQ